MVGPDYGTVDDQVLHVRVIDEMLMHSCPYSALTPSGKPLVDAVPFPYSEGSSLHGAPDLLIQMMASMNRLQPDSRPTYKSG